MSKFFKTHLLSGLLTFGPCFGFAAENHIPLASALHQGLRNHPAILRSDADLRIRLAETLTFTQIPNPRLEAEFRSLSSEPLVDFKFMQPIKRSYFGLRENYAAIERVSARTDARAQVVGVLNDVFSRYIELWTVQELGNVRERNREDLVSLREGLARTVEVGQGSKVDLALLDAEIAHQTGEREALTSQLLGRSAALAARIAYKGEGMIHVDRPSGLALPRDSGELVEFAIARTPLRMALLKREEAARASLAIERADRFGGIEAGVITEYDSARGGLMLGLGFTFDLPVWNRNEAGIASAAAAIDAARAELRQVEPGRVAAFVKLRHRSALAAERSARRYRENVLPLFEEALAQAGEAIARGQAGVTQIQPVIGRLSETRLRAFDLDVMALEARAELEAALGGRLEEAMGASIRN